MSFSEQAASEVNESAESGSGSGSVSESEEKVTYARSKKVMEMDALQ